MNLILLHSVLLTGYVLWDYIICALYLTINLWFITYRRLHHCCLVLSLLLVHLLLHLSNLDHLTLWNLLHNTRNPRIIWLLLLLILRTLGKCNWYLLILWCLVLSLSVFEWWRSSTDILLLLSLGLLLLLLHVPLDQLPCWCWILICLILWLLDHFLLHNVSLTILNY